MIFISAVVIPFFWEGVLFALLINVIYRSDATIFAQLLSPLVVSIFIFLIILMPLREKLRIHV
jgi:hypothetical protein